MPPVPLIAALSLLLPPLGVAVPPPSGRLPAPPGWARAGAVATSVRLAPEPPQASFGWPLASARVVRRFDPPPKPWLPGHRGVDLAGRPAEAVHAAGAGVVVYAGSVAGRGVVSVGHAGGLRTTYEPVTASVAPGDAVQRGGVLGTLDAGHPGCAEAACLHWGLRRENVYLDPLVLLGIGRVRLLPLDGRSSPG